MTRQLVMTLDRCHIDDSEGQPDVAIADLRLMSPTLEWYLARLRSVQRNIIAATGLILDESKLSHREPPPKLVWLRERRGEFSDPLVDAEQRYAIYTNEKTWPKTSEVVVRTEWLITADGFGWRGRIEDLEGHITTAIIPWSVLQ